MIVQKAYGFKLEEMDPQGQAGRFHGVAVIYGETDSYGDTIKAGAFTKSIAEASGKLPLLWVHRAHECLGSIRIEQDAKALNVSGSLLVDDIPRAREVHALLRSGAVKGLSVGFVPTRATPNEGGGVEYAEGRLLEISLCPTPAFSSAQVSEVKAITELAQTLDPVHNKAALVALRDSIDAMLHGSSGRPEPGATELLEAFKGFNAAKWKWRPGGRG